MIAECRPGEDMARGSSGAHPAQLCCISSGGKSTRISYLSINTAMQKYSISKSTELNISKALVSKCTCAEVESIHYAECPISYIFKCMTIFENSGSTSSQCITSRRIELVDHSNG